MAVINLGEPTPVLAARRVVLDAASVLALRRVLERDGLSLPDDLLVEVNPAEAALAGVDLDALQATAERALGDAGLVEDEGLVQVVRENVRGVGAAPRRVRSTYAGGATRRVAHHWVGPALGGGAVRDGERLELSLFDVRGLGDELRRVLPQDAVDDESGRAEITVPLEDLVALAALEEQAVGDPQGGLGDLVAEFLGVDAGLAGTVRAWVAAARGVLHVAATVPDGARDAADATDAVPATRDLLWVASDDGWWNLAPLTRPDGSRVAVLTPRAGGDLAADLGLLLAGAWT